MKTATQRTQSFKLDENHRLTVRKRETGTNYNTFAHVFVNGSKVPEFGTSFNDSTPLTDIKKWAMESIAKPDPHFIRYFSKETKRVETENFTSFEAAKAWGEMNLENFNVEQVQKVIV